MDSGQKDNHMTTNRTTQPKLPPLPEPLRCELDHSQPANWAYGPGSSATIGDAEWPRHLADLASDWRTQVRQYWRSFHALTGELECAYSIKTP